MYFKIETDRDDIQSINLNVVFNNGECIVSSSSEPVTDSKKPSIDEDTETSVVYSSEKTEDSKKKTPKNTAKKKVLSREDLISAKSLEKETKPVKKTQVELKKPPVTDFSKREPKVSSSMQEKF